jgi:hypothetical protein
MKKFIVDTLIGVMFWFIVMMLVETIFFNMTIEQSFITRCGAILINSLTSGINAMFMDWFRKKINPKQKNNLLKYLTDTVGTIIFQLPVYVIILTTSHTVQFILNGNWGVNKYFIEIVNAFTYLPIVFLCVGGIYGILLDNMRKLLIKD